MAKKLHLVGTRGKSAYQYALDGGYTGSEADFKEKMKRELEVAYDYDDLNSKILATAIKQEASGTVISISDAAAVPLLGLDYEGENVTFTMCGKNLWNAEYASDFNNWVPSTVQSGYSDMLIYVGTEKYVTLSYKDELTTGLGVFAGVVRDENGTITQYLYHSNNASLTTRVITAPANNSYIRIRCHNDSLKNGTFMQYIGNYLQIELGSVATEYEPYTAKSITVASPDELNLNDFVMNNPNTVITNDQNLPMTVTYVADPQIYIDNLAASLTNAVVSLGGEV